MTCLYFKKKKNPHMAGCYHWDGCQMFFFSDQMFKESATFCFSSLLSLIIAIHQCLLQNHLRVGFMPHWDSSSARNTNQLLKDNLILRYVINTHLPHIQWRLLSDFIFVSCVYYCIIAAFDRFAHTLKKCAHRCFQLLNIRIILLTGSTQSHPSSLF